MAAKAVAPGKANPVGIADHDRTAETAIERSLLQRLMQQRGIGRTRCHARHAYCDDQGNSYSHTHRLHDVPAPFVANAYPPTRRRPLS